MRSWSVDLSSQGPAVGVTMLSGVAVARSDSGAIPESTGGPSLLFPEGDQRSHAERLPLLMERPHLAGHGRERALRLCPGSALANRTYEVVEPILTARTIAGAT